MSLILMTTLFDKAVILRGAIWRWSFSGLKGLNLDQERLFADVVNRKETFQYYKNICLWRKQNSLFPEG